MTLIWCCAALAAVTWELPPREGVEGVLTVVDDRGAPESGETVRAVHRPGLAGEREVAIGITDGRGRVRWTPEDAGIARIRAGDATQLVRIEAAALDPTPLLLLALLLGAGASALVVAIREARE